MRPSPVSSLLVAALVLLRQPSTRNKASARLLLDRAAGYDSLSHAEREACRNLADELDIDASMSSGMPASRARSPIPTLHQASPGRAGILDKELAGITP